MPGTTFLSLTRTAARGLLACLLALLMSGGASAQLAGVQMDIRQENLGIGGAVQRGIWTPVRMDLMNTGADTVEVTCRWMLSDEDGDELIAERRNITLLPAQPQSVWMYANPPMSTRPGQNWNFQVVSAETGELINQTELQLAESSVVDASANLVGVCGFKGLGLTPWQRWSTQHEQLRLVRGLNLETLPDRWYGMDGLSALVWFPVEGGEPTSNRMSDSSKRALREWVFRGGHLVLIMPYAGQQWTSADSSLADLLEPIKASDINQVRARPPISLFGVLRSAKPVPMVTFDVSHAPQYSTLAQADVPTTSTPGGPTAKQSLVVGRRFGFGQVTLVGIDLSDTSVLTSLDSFRMHRIWTRIFNWRASMTGELLPVSEFENPQTRNQYREAKDANHVELATWIGSQVSRQRQTGPAIGLAFILFVVYAVAAALTFPNLLRAKGWERHSWMVFVGIVTFFSIIAWGGAWALKPASSSAAHFTVLDIDGNTNLVRAKSWQSLLIPNFTNTSLEVPSSSEGMAKMDVVNLVASPGHDLRPEAPGYPDRRTYAFDAAQPDQVGVPMRSTTKSLVIDFLGQITAKQDGLEKPWTMPVASLRIASNGLPAGTITHHFPDSLTDVFVVYCPGGGQTPGLPTDPRPAGRPLVYEYRNANNQSVWDPKTPMVLPPTPKAYTPLWLRPKLGATSRGWKDEGFLGKQVHGRRFGEQSGSSAIVYDAALLSFYDALPPPIYETRYGGFNIGVQGVYNTYSRSLAREIDLTPLITGQRIIVIGHLRTSPSPVPMTADGQTVDSEGWTVVRWIYDL